MPTSALLLIAGCACLMIALILARLTVRQLRVRRQRRRALSEPGGPYYIPPFLRGPGALDLDAEPLDLLEPDGLHIHPWQPPLRRSATEPQTETSSSGE